MKAAVPVLALAACVAHGVCRASDCPDGSFPIVCEIPLDFDDYCRGVAWDGAHFWVSAGDMGSGQAQFYILDEGGTLLSNFPQGAGASGWGHRNLCFAEGYVWGSFGHTVNAFDPATLLDPLPPDYAYVGYYVGCLSTHHGLAYGCNPPRFYGFSFAQPMMCMWWDGVWGSTAGCEPLALSPDAVRGMTYDEELDCIWVTTADHSGDLLKFSCDWTLLDTYTTLPEYSSHGDCAMADTQQHGRVLAMLIEDAPDRLVLYDVGAASAVDPSDPPREAIGLTARPNPFTTTTLLTYSREQPGPLEIAIYDASGRIVRHLRSGTTAAGPGMVEWDGLNDEGLPISPGVYHCRLLVHGATRMQRVLALRH